LNGRQLLKTAIQIRMTILAALLAAATLPAAAQVSLATVVDLAQRNSTTVKLAQADRDKAVAALAESRDTIIPSLSFSSGLPAFKSVGFMGSTSSIWSATVQSLVFSVPQIRYIGAASSGVRAADATLKDAREQAALDASVAYIEFDAINNELAAAHHQEADAAHLVDIEKERTEAGVDPLNDYLQARLTAAQIRLKRLHLETRTGTLAKQLATLTGLPVGSILPDHASIPQIPNVNGEIEPRLLRSIESARLVAKSKYLLAKGDQEASYLPRMSFFAQYNRNSNLLNENYQWYAKPIPTNNFSSGFSIQVPLFDMPQRAKARESAADALRAKVEAEQAERQNEVQVATLTGNIRELDAQSEIAMLQQQIADNQLKTVAAQLSLGNGQSTGQQLSPKAEQAALIDQEQKQIDALDAAFELSKARLNLLRALGHMDDWLHTFNK
jgi:outer membrane protein TolC